MTDQYHDMMVLQAWFSPAFPTGAFSYSHGLETAIQEERVHDAASLKDWIATILDHGSGRNDALFIKAAYDGDEVVNDLCLSLCSSRERQQETVELGQAFIRTVNASYDVDLPDGLAYPVAVGQAARQMGLDLELTIQGYLQAFAASLISVGVRIIPVGQQAGQDCLVALTPTIRALAEGLSHASLNELGGAAFLSDLMAMKHEQSSPRIYRT